MIKQSRSPSRAAARLLTVFAIFLGLVGLSLAWLGWMLLQIQGSPYYILAGALMVISAVLVARRNWGGVWLYWLYFGGTLVWALWESGLDGWALAPRLAMPAIMGLWMLTPWFRLAMRAGRPLPGGRILWPALGLLIVGSIGFFFWMDRSPEPTGGIASNAAPANPLDGEWRYYGNDQGGSRFSPLGQITPANVAGLQRIWSYHTGPVPGGASASFETTPLKIGDRLYFCTGYNDIVALDAETGKQIWRHSSHVDTAGVFGLTCRGVAYYKVPDATGPCAERIYTATLDARLLAVDANDGKLCAGFGKNGETSLLQGMGPVEKSYYFVTSPPQIVRGRLVVGGWVTDGQMVGEPSGVIRAFDAITGNFSWAFDIGKPDFHGLPPEGQTFTRGTPNSWAPMSADEKLGLLYAPTGNATPDYFAAHRTPNMDRYSSSVVAIDAETGAARWSFQTTHHDLWDYDVPSQPTLVDLPGGIKGLLQPTKRGETFFLDRVTGKPLAPVTERAVPHDGVPEEHISPTQPFSAKWLSFPGPVPSEKTMWGLTPIDQAWCRILFKRARFDGTMTPLNTKRPTVIWPGYLGGSNWGSIAVDRLRHVMIINTNQVINYDWLITRADADKQGIRPRAVNHVTDVGGPAAQKGTPYAAHVGPFLSPLAIPCNQPPYGMIRGVDLRSGKVLWEKPFGTSRDSGPLAMPTFVPIPMGVPNIGGAVTTASGLTFIGATQEHALRAFETTTGKQLWKTRLPAGGQATPATYWSNKSGRQFVVIAAGGHGAMLSGQSDEIVAYALSDQIRGSENR